MRNEVLKEAIEIKKILKNEIPEIWDGKKCILELREADFNWRQMEWIGWYFEYKARKVLIENFGGQSGPAFGRTPMDYKNKFVWDFKAHPVNSPSHPWAIMNDCEAVNRCIEENNGIGFIIALGEAEYNDVEGSFKRWHSELKGEQTKYVKARIKRGAPSRKRKINFRIQDYLMIFLQDYNQIIRGMEERWLSGDAQTGWRNANGSPRRAKYKIKLNSIKKWAMV